MTAPTIDPPVSRWPNEATAQDVSDRLHALAAHIRRTVDTPNGRDYIGKPDELLENAVAWENAVEALELVADAWAILSYQLPAEVVGQNFNRGARR